MEDDEKRKKRRKKIIRFILAELGIMIAAAAVWLARRFMTK